MTHVTPPKNRRAYRTAMGFLLCVALLLGAASQAAAQQKDKKSKKDTPAPTSNTPSIPLPDEQQIDYMISTMLGAWQVGDIDKLHRVLRGRRDHRQLDLESPGRRLEQLSPAVPAAARPHAASPHGPLQYASSK